MGSISPHTSEVSVGVYSGMKREITSIHSPLTAIGSIRRSCMGILEIKGDQNFASEYMELTGSSIESFEDAVANAMRRAYQTKKRLTGFQLVEGPARIDNDRELGWQVTLKVGCLMTPETN